MKSSPNRLLAISAVSMTFALASTANAAILAEYDFDDGTGVPSQVGSDVNASNFTWQFSGNNPSFTNERVQRGSNNAISETNFFTISLASDDPALPFLDLDTFELSLISLQTASGRNTELQIRTSIDGFTNNLLFDYFDADDNKLNTDPVDTVAVGQNFSVSFARVVADLSALPLTEDIEFRIYIGRTGSLNHTAGIDDVLVTGNLEIPEPASLALLGLGGLILMGRRR
ncbi:MAG: PEP-CTERM sorting domain-containing protein [Phycisphaeraceae bacterium]|nr:PEP-CTERM sorting domain-containing protein [Phycisphaeraceae bacterium]